MPESINQTEMLNPHSVELSRGQSGKIGITVKAYGKTMEDAANEARKVFSVLSAQYPNG